MKKRTQPKPESVLLVEVRVGRGWKPHDLEVDGHRAGDSYQIAFVDEDGARELYDCRCAEYVRRAHAPKRSKP